jgi:hypothetical protein
LGSFFVAELEGIPRARDGVGFARDRKVEEPAE